MRTTAYMNAYSGGIMTEDMLRCSSTENEVNHGVLLVGYGKRTDEQVHYGQC